MTGARESSIAGRLAVYAQQLEARLHPVFAEAVAETLNLLTVQPDSHERVSLPYKITNTKPRPELEARMLELINKERGAHGLRPLAPDPELTVVARKHSGDMFARGYFAHDTPEGRSPFDRMHDGGVSFLTAGENLALAPTQFFWFFLLTIGGIMAGAWASGRMAGKVAPKRQFKRIEAPA